VKIPFATYVAEPIRIETTCKVVFNPLFKKPGVVDKIFCIRVLLRSTEKAQLPGIGKIAGNRR
jgi:hypothetical protein